MPTENERKYLLEMDCEDEILFASLTGLRRPNFSHSEKSKGFPAADG